MCGHRRWGLSRVCAAVYRLSGTTVGNLTASFNCLIYLLNLTCYLYLMQLVVVICNVIYLFPDDLSKTIGWIYKFKLGIWCPSLNRWYKFGTAVVQAQMLGGHLKLPCAASNGSSFYTGARNPFCCWFWKSVMKIVLEVFGELSSMWRQAVNELDQ